MPADVDKDIQRLYELYVAKTLFDAGAQSAREEPSWLDKDAQGVVQVGWRLSLGAFTLAQPGQAPARLARGGGGEAFRACIARRPRRPPRS